MVMSAAMVLIFVAPMVMAINAVVQNIDVITGSLQKLSTASLPAPPPWVQNIPLVGTPLAAKWTSVSGAGSEQLAARVQPYATSAAQWIVGAFGSGGVLIIQFLLTVIICVVMYANGEYARAALLRFGKRLAGVQGEGAVILAGQAIRAVALGVVVTALTQTVLTGIGLTVAGVPFAGFLTGVALLLCIAQIGPILVLAPAVAYLFWIDATTAATGLLVWTILVGAIDNVLRPLLIKRGADLPLLLIFAGVIGGLIAFGIIGLFVGPVVLAVAYTLLQQWTAAGEHAEETAAVTRRVRAAS
jgi:predicted PurR-regulated permease PerM